MTSVYDLELTTELENQFDLPDMYLEKLYLLMKTMTKYFKQNHIKYFAEGGTLLGIMREKGQIKYDNDIDLGMLEGDFIKLLKCKNDIEKKFDFIVQYDSYCVKIFAKGVALEPEPDKIIHPCMDIFCYKRYNNRIQIVVGGFENSYFRESEFLPLVKRKYHDIDVYTANQSVPYLERYYGNWKKKIYTHKVYEKSKNEKE